MLLLVNGATKDVEPLVGDLNLGVLLTPGTKGGGPKNDVRRIVKWKVRWAVDNGAFSLFDAPAFLRLLASITGQPGCQFVATPDVVADAAKTMARFEIWAPLIREIGLPVALVTQDGLKLTEVPWGKLDAVFVGGSDAWKFSDASAEICGEAKRRGVWIHVGRVNSKLRMRAALAMGADSVDGSQFSWWPRRYVPKGLRWIREAQAELAQDHRQYRFGGCSLSSALAAARKFRGSGKAFGAAMVTDSVESSLFEQWPIHFPSRPNAPAHTCAISARIRSGSNRLA